MNYILVVGGGCSEVFVIAFERKAFPSVGNWKQFMSRSCICNFDILVQIKIHFAWLWLHIHGVMCSRKSFSIFTSC